MFLKQRLLLLLTPLVLIPFTILGAGMLYISEVQNTFSSFDETLLKIVIGVFFLVIAGIALMVIHGTARAISSPIQEAAFYVARIARGERNMSVVVEDAQGEIAELIDNLGQMQADLAKYEQELQKKTEIESMGRVASQVAHDIRSPLSALQAAVSLLQNREATSGEQQDALNLLRLSSSRLEKIANGLLAKYKGIQAETEMFSIHELLDVLVGEIQATPLGTGVEFKKQYWSSALHMKGDYSSIQRSIYNIIKNGIEAMRVCSDDRNMILTLRTAKHRNSLEVRISDNGMGIEPDKISKIIAGGYTAGKEDGHGLGMQVVNDTMQKHHGEIRVESTPGAGTSFILIFPIAAEAMAEIQSNSELSLPKGTRYIVIDDDPALREQWRLALHAIGVQVALHVNWEDFNACHPEAKSKSLDGCTFIIDYHFENSEVDGLTIIRHLKERCCGNFVLATAEYWKPAIKDAAQQLGITLCPKPLPRVILGTSEGSKDSRILLLDDDPAIQLAWKLQSKYWGVRSFHAFSSMEDCQQSDISLDEIDAAFVDKNIEGSSWPLDQVIAHLKSNGVRRVWVASGESQKDLSSDPLCAQADGIVDGKVPEKIDRYLNS